MKKVISTIAVGVGLMGAVSFAQNDTSSYNTGTGSSSDVNSAQPGTDTGTMQKSTPGKTMEQKMDQPSDTTQNKDQTKKKKHHKKPSADMKDDGSKNINSTESNP